MGYVGFLFAVIALPPEIFEQKTSLHPPKKLPGTLPPEVGCFVLAIFWRVLPPSHLLKRRLDVQGMMGHLLCFATSTGNFKSKTLGAILIFLHVYLPKPSMFCGVRFVSLNIQSYLFWVCFGGLYWQMNALVLVLLVFVWLQWPCRDFKNTSVPECSSSRMAMEWCLWWWLQTVWNTVSLGFHHH